MKAKRNSLISLSEALQALQGRKEFAIIKEDGLVGINYLFQAEDSFEGIRANFRGIVFDEGTGEIVSLPFHKFFSINQTAETQFGNIAHLDGTIYEKVDGSLIHFYRHKGKLHASTRMNRNTPQAQSALHHVNSKEPNLLKHIEEEIDEGRTPLFEFIGPGNQIVVPYQQTRLIYLASRDRKTGAYTFNENFPAKTSRLSFPFRDIHQHLEKENFEGYVVWLESGLWVKAKSQWYLERHHALDALMRPAWKLYEIHFQGFLDDVIASSADKYQPALRKIQEEANRDFINLCSHITSTAEQLKVEFKRDDNKEERKQFAINAQMKHPEFFPHLMNTYLGKDMTSLVQETLLEKYRAKYPNPLYSDLL